MTKYTLHDIHIDPEKTWLMDFDEYYGGKKTYSKYLIEPYGPYQHNELLDTVYVDPNHEMCYHEHTRGVETFLVDGGSVLTESIFSWPGVGRFVVDSISYKDTPAVLGSVVTLAILFTIVNLIVDLLYAFLDPRIKSEYQSSWKRAKKK